MTEIMILAGEASGEMYGARLAQALRQKKPAIKLCGMGGSAMAEAGVEILVDTSEMAVMGLVEIFAHLQTIRAAKKILVTRLKQHLPALLILIDYAEFNLLLAKQAKKLGIPVLFYISPKVWVWRTGRVKKIKRLVDAMAVILPFEQQFYQQWGMTVHYVGHPLVEMVQSRLTPAHFFAQHNLHPQGRVIGILPGSRRKEIATMLPVFLEAAAQLGQHHKNLTFLLPLASTLTMADLEENGLHDFGLKITVISSEQRYELMAACDLVMAASGTVTLELALLQIPMIVSYRLAPLTYHLGHRLIKVKYASLVNLIANQEIVPELLQYDATPGKISTALERLWPGGKPHQKMLTQLALIRKSLGQGGCADKVADLALQTMKNPSS